MAHLSPNDAQLFFRLWSYLDAFTNAHVGLLPAADSPEEIGACSPVDLDPLRRALRGSPQLIDEFIRDNPYSLSAEDLAYVEPFRHCVHGTFFVERALKKHAMLIAAEDGATVYATLGITESVQELLERAVSAGVGRMVETTLVPFQGQLVWDGIVRVVNMSFGSNARRSFADAYRRAKEQGEIIVSVGGDGPKTLPKPRRSTVDWRPAVRALAVGAKDLGRPNKKLQAAAFRLLKHAANLAELSLKEPLDYYEMQKLLQKAARALDQIDEEADWEWYGED